MRLAIVSARTTSSPATSARAAGPAGDGPERRVSELASALAGTGHEVRVFVPDHATGAVPTGGAPVVSAPAAGDDETAEESEAARAAETFGRALPEAWAGWRPDLIHAHHWLGGVAAMTAAQSADDPMPVALTYHDVGTSWQRFLGDDRDHGLAQRITMERHLGRTVDWVITQSHAETEALARLGVSRRRMTMVPAGVDPSAFTPRGPAASRQSSQRRIVTVGSAGRLDERKGIGEAIRALSRLPSAELVVVGGGPERDLANDPQAQRLRALAAECEVADRVRFVGGVSREQMPDWYRSADLVVCPSWYEPFGMSALEAMACGVPVVATAVGGHRDTIVDGLTGMLVPPRDPAALAQAMRRVLADPIRQMAYAAAARDRARQCYAWDRVVRCLTGTYQQLCPEPDHQLTQTASA